MDEQKKCASCGGTDFSEGKCAGCGAPEPTDEVPAMPAEEPAQE